VVVVYNGTCMVELKPDSAHGELIGFMIVPSVLYKLSKLQVMEPI